MFAFLRRRQGLLARVEALEKQVAGLEKLPLEWADTKQVLVRLLGRLDKYAGLGKIEVPKQGNGAEAHEAAPGDASAPPVQPQPEPQAFSRLMLLRGGR